MEHKDCFLDEKLYEETKEKIARDIARKQGCPHYWHLFLSEAHDIISTSFSAQD